MKFLRNKHITCGILLILQISSVYALSSDRNKPIKLSADHVSIDNTNGVSVYTNNVTMTQGTLEIKGDKLVVHTDENNKLEKVTVTGKLATYKQLPDNKKTNINATAKKIEYTYSGIELVILYDQASLWQENNKFSGDKIEYQVMNDVVTASSKDEHSVIVIINPETSSSPQQNSHAYELMNKNNPTEKIEHSQDSNN